MKTKNAVNWFEIPVDDFERAVSFYQRLFDVQLRHEVMDGFDCALFPADEQAVGGALVKADFQRPGAAGSLVYLNAEGKLDALLQRATDMGAQVTLPRTAIGEYGFIAHLLDSEGNKIAVHSFGA
jgi:predicted enzyme related to lactoylglutathione lyase